VCAPIFSRGITVATMQEQHGLSFRRKLLQCSCSLELLLRFELRDRILNGADSNS